MSQTESVLVFGAGGHAKVVIDVLRSQAVWEPVAVFDDNPTLTGTVCRGLPVLGDRHALLAYAQERGVKSFIAALGNNQQRAEVFAFLAGAGLQAITAIHASAVIAPGVCVGAGTVVMPGVCINADAAIGENVILNTGARIDHDVVIADTVHIAPGVCLCGGVSVGNRTLVGVGASVIPGINIGKDAVVAAGAVVTADVMNGFRVAGVPARAG